MRRQNKMTLVGLEPTISGSVDRCLIHWATGPSQNILLPGWKIYVATFACFTAPVPKRPLLGLNQRPFG